MFKWNTPYAPHTSIQYVTWPHLPGTNPHCLCDGGFAPEAHMWTHLYMYACVCVHEELVIFRSIQCVFHPQLPDHCSVFRLFFSPALLYPVFCINCLLPRCLCDEQNVSVAEPMEGEPPQWHSSDATCKLTLKCPSQLSLSAVFSA